ncbi:fibronectin type III domain-containing protein [Haloferax namakaokahaiae]|uniref:Fibronectin type III domain-containing protein n=1 Tax=Haloferax namakaokahaiae TaxID=1748331 RepID=A0ABD5ZCA3_9EURY
MEIEVTSTLPANTSVTLVIEEDQTSDGTVDASDSFVLSGGNESFSSQALSYTQSNVHRIDATFANTDRSAAASITSVTLIQTSTALTSLSATPSGGDVDLSWSEADTDYDHANIYRATSSGASEGDYTLIDTVPSGTTKYTDTAVLDGEQYFYRVQSEQSNGDKGNLSNEDSATVPIPNVSGLSTTPTTTSIGLSWTNNHEQGAVDGIDVAFKRSSAGSWTVDATLSATAESHTITGLLTGEEYDVEIRPYSEHTTPSTPTSATVTTDFAAITGLMADASVEDELTPMWDDTANYGDYRVQHRVYGSGDAYTDNGTVAESVTELTIPNLLDGEKYALRIRHETEHGSGAWTEISPVTLLPKPGVPSFTNIGDTSADVSFGDFADNEDGHRILVEEELDEIADTGFGPEVEFADLAPNVTSDTLSGLAQNRKYRVTIETYTEHVFSRSDSSIFTTTFSIPTDGWFATFTDSAGEVARLFESSMEGYPTLQPEKSAVGAWHIDIRPERSLRDWTRSEVRIYLNGEVEFRGPFVAYRLNGSNNKTADRLEGYDVVDKLRHGGDVVTYQSMRGDAALEDYIDNYTPFTANVTTPDETTVDEDRLVQESPEDLSFEDLFGDPDSSDAWKRVGSGASATIEPLQRSFLMEGESASGSYDPFFDSDFSDGEAINLDTAGQSASWTFTLDYDIPAGELELFVRIRGTNNSSQVKWSLDSTELLDTVFSTNDIISFETLSDSAFWTDPGGVPAGTYTLTAEVSSEGSENFLIDAVAPVDGRANYTLPSSLTNGKLDAPVDYPGVTIEGSAFDSTFNIKAATLTPTTDDTPAAERLQLQNNGTDWFPTDGSEDDTSSVTVDFAAEGSLGTDVKGRITLGGHGTRDSAIPRTGYQPDVLSGWDLSVTTNSLRVIDDQTYSGSPFDILTSIADDSGMLVVPDYDESSLVLNAFAPGDVTKSVDWKVVDVPQPVDTTDGFANSVTVFGPEDEQGNRLEVEAVSQTSVDAIGKIEAPALFRPDANSTAELESIARTELSQKLANDTVTGQIEIESQILQPGYAYEVSEFEEIDVVANPRYVLQSSKFSWGTMRLDFEGRDNFVRALRSIDTDVQTTKRAL